MLLIVFLEGVQNFQLKYSTNIPAKFSIDRYEIPISQMTMYYVVERQ